MPLQNLKNERTKLVSTRISERDYIQLAQMAESRGASVSEYTRRRLLESLSLGCEARFLAAELLAFQEVFLALILASLNGDALSENRVTELRARFAGIKSALVDQALEQFQSSNARNV